MCKIATFRYVCGCTKYKLADPCAFASRSYQGIISCSLDLNPSNTTPSTTETYDRETVGIRYGYGVCHNVHCAWKYGLLPIGDFGKAREHWEDDSEIEESEEAALAREDRWYRECLTNEQQLDCLSFDWPVKAEDKSEYARMFLTDFEDSESINGDIDRVNNVKIEELKWQELNPRYMSASVLQKAMSGHYLPASVVVGKSNKRISPLKARSGPFAVGKHFCRKKPGICSGCGKNVGNPKLLEGMYLYGNSPVDADKWLSQARGLPVEDALTVLCGQTEGFVFVEAIGAWRRRDTYLVDSPVDSGPMSLAKEVMPQRSSLGARSVARSGAVNSDVNIIKEEEMEIDS